MSKYDLPELPSDDELGITDEDREAYAKDFGDDKPEMSDAERRALLGDAPPPKSSADPKGSRPDPGAARKAEKARKKAEKERLKAEKQRLKEEKKRAKAKKSAPSASSAKRAGEPASKDDQQRRLEAIRAAGAAAASGAARPGTGQQAPGGSGGGKPPGGPPPEQPKTPPGSPAGGPRSRWRGPVTLAVLILVAAVASSRTGLPRPVPANAADTAFSSSRAMSTLIEIAREPHPPGSPEHERVRSLLVDRLRALGLEPEVQTTTSMIQSATRARAATVRNIVARVPGTDPTGAVLLTAHYDGREISRAAADDGSGVVTILEAVRAVLAGQPLRNDLIVLFTDGEELGLLGARAFVQEHPAMADVSIVLSFEMRGSAGPSIMFETNDQNGWVVRALDAFDPEPFANSMAFEIYERMPNDTDFTPFKEAGEQGLNFGAIDNAHVYHQEYDTPERVSESTLQHHGIHALEAARWFGRADLSDVNDPNVVYFTVPFLGLLVYPQVFVLPISGLLVLLAVGAFFATRRSGARPARMGVGILVALIAGAAAWGASYALLEWLPRFHAEAGSLHGAEYHGEGWYVLALVGLAFAAVTGAYTLARRWLGIAELGLGAVVLPFLGALLLGFAAPLAAMNLQVPVLAALLAVVTVGLLGARADKVVGWIAVVLLALPVLVLLVPLTELVWLALTFDLGAWLTVPILIALFLCMPALEAMRHPNAWWAPVAGVVVAAAAVGLGIVTGRPGDERPLPSTLVYAYEHGTGAAVWATDPGADSLDAEATAWAVERAGGSFDGTRDLSGFAYPAGQIPTVAAPVVAAQPPEVTIVRDTIDGTTRRVTLHVRSRIGAELLAFTYDGRGSTRILTINGEKLDAPAQLERVEHWGQPEEHVVLELEMAADEPIGLHVVEHLLRPEELLGAGAFARPPRLAADITRLSDRAMFRYSVAAFVDPRHAILPPPGPGGAPPDTSAVRPDTSATPPDTTAVDTSAAPRDTVAAPADTVAVPRDTAVADTTSPRDTTASPRDTTTSPRDTTAMPRDTGPAERSPAPGDTLPAPVDTLRAAVLERRR